MKARYLAAIFIVIFFFSTHILYLQDGREPMFAELNYPLAKNKSYPRRMVSLKFAKNNTLFSLLSSPLFLSTWMLNQRTILLSFRNLAPIEWVEVKNVVWNHGSWLIFFPWSTGLLHWWRGHFTLDHSILEGIIILTICYLLSHSKY